MFEKQINKRRPLLHLFYFNMQKKSFKQLLLLLLFLNDTRRNFPKVNSGISRLSNKTEGEEKGPAPTSWAALSKDNYKTDASAPPVHKHCKLCTPCGINMQIGASAVIRAPHTSSY